MVPDEDNMVMALTALEAQIDRSGWDKDPLLLMSVKMSGRPVLGFLGIDVLLGDPVDGITVIADAWEAGETQQYLASLDEVNKDEFCGVFLVAEVYMTTPPGVPVPAHWGPDAVGHEVREARQVWGVDPGGRLYMLTRFRGDPEPPEVLTFLPRAAGELGGLRSADGRSTNFLVGLVRLVRAFARVAPPDSSDPDRLELLLREVGGRG